MIGRAAASGRIAWTVLTILVVEIIVCGLAAVPAVALWYWLTALTAGRLAWRLLVFSVAAVPSYVLFALCLMPVAAAAMRLTGWRTPPDAEMPIAGLGWPLLQWARCMASIHVVRLLAGTLFRGSPIWTAYVRMCGARLGRRVYLNSLAISDYNLLDFGDDVVVGADVHISGHTVERGLVKTAHVRLANGVTVGLGSVVEIDVEAGPGCQIGALSFVPKHARLDGGTVYAGIPVDKIDVTLSHR